MITRVEALNYRCLRYVAQDLGPFHVLVGPNASGKTSFVDVLAFLSRFMADGLDAAIAERTSNFYDLVWGRQGSRFELAIEAQPPESAVVDDEVISGASIRYELAVEIDSKLRRTRVAREQVHVARTAPQGHDRPRVNGDVPPSLFLSEWSGGKLAGAFMQVVAESDVFAGNAETIPPQHPAELEAVPRPNRRFLLPEGPNVQMWMGLELRFPVATWLRDLLAKSLVKVDLSASDLRSPAPPGRAAEFVFDGSNVPVLVQRLHEIDLERYEWWIKHLQTALPDLKGLRVIDRPEDRHRYLMLQYANGLEVPSWMASEGTLRFIALTLLAYSPDAPRLCIVEEPETSIHPLNVELVMQSLQSAPDRQVLVTTHSPTVLSSVKAEDVLVFSRDEEHGVRIVRGDQHAGLAYWKGSPDLSVLYASGVFG